MWASFFRPSGAVAYVLSAGRSPPIMFYGSSHVAHMIHLNLLGPVQITEDADGKGGDQSAHRFRSRRTVALLGYLAAERSPRSREFLATFFWPDETLARGRTNLRREIYNLARLLPGCWQIDAQTVAFCPKAIAVDIDLIIELRDQERWVEAAALLNGQFLEGIHIPDSGEFDNWLWAEREKWQQRSLAVLESAANELAGRGRFADALTYTWRRLQLAPWDEEAQRQAMCLLAWTGQREQALKQFDAYRQVLADELGLEPATETVSLYDQITANELAPPPPLPAFLAPDATDHNGGPALFVMRDQELTWLERQLTEALAGRGRVAFVTGGPGRGKTSILEVFSRRALSTYPDLLVARGNCAAYAGAGDPYLPFRDVMAMLSGEVEARWAAGAISTAHARRLWQSLPLVLQAILDHGPSLIDILVPGLSLLKRATAGGPACIQLAESLEAYLQLHSQGPADTEQNYLFEQFSNVLRTVSDRRPLLLVLDDLQWIDAASVALLFHLVKRMVAVSSRILIVGAYRPEEIMCDQSGPRSLLAQALSEFKRIFGDGWLSLAWSEQSRGRQFVDAVIDSEPNDLDQPFRAALFQRTGGHPLFTLELLQALRDGGHLICDAGGRWQVGTQIDWQMIPARVEAVIAGRIRRLEPNLQAILAVASVEGELFTAQVVAHVLDRPVGPVLHQLAQELAGDHHLVREREAYRLGNQSVTRFSFRHALFQEYLYRRLTVGEKQLLHQAVGTAIEQVYGPELEAWEVQLAHHFDRADNPERALHYYSAAAENAARVYAYDEAVAHYRRAIDLAWTTAASPCKANLYYGRGMAFGTRGQFDLARADFERALELSQAAGAPAAMTWRALLELGKLWTSRDYLKAYDYLQRALDLAHALDDPTSMGISLNHMGNWFANDENPAEALQCHREALHIFEALDDRPNLANTLDFLAIAHLLTGDTSATVTGYYNRAVELFRELGNYPRLVSSLIPRALISAGPNMLAAAPTELLREPSADLDEALAIARRIGSAPDEAWCAWAKSMLYIVSGDYGRALAAARHGLDLADALNHREWQVGNRYAMGLVYFGLLQPEMALPELEAALAQAGELRSRYWINHASAALAQALLLLGDFAGAQSCLEAVLTPGTAEDTAGKRLCWASRARLALAMDEPEQALDIAQRLLATAAGLAPGGVITPLWLLHGEALLVLRRTDEANEILSAGYREAQYHGQRPLVWRFQAALARVHLARGCHTAANQALAAARHTIEELAGTVDDPAGEGLLLLLQGDDLGRCPALGGGLAADQS